MLTVLTEAHSCILDTRALDVIISRGEPDQFKGREDGGETRPDSMKQNLHFLN